jgi:hypothetical protein
MRARKTLLIQARSRAEAQAKLDKGFGVGVNTDYYAVGRARVVRQDKARKTP